MISVSKLQVPVLRQSTVLRAEYFGGFLMNQYLPSEMKLDHVRYGIACMCNGAYTLQEILDQLEHKLDHSRDYVNHLVNCCLQLFNKYHLLDWRESKQDQPRIFDERVYSPVESQRHLSAPLGVIWELTRSCNLRCKHCFSNSGRREERECMTHEIKTTIDLLADHKIFYINFTGGEPFLRTDLFDILEHASTKILFIDLSTNGFLVTKETIRRLRATNVFQVQLSIDGLEDFHDRFRGVAGSFQKALEAIRLFKQANFRIVISSTVNKMNINLISDLIDLALHMGAAVFKTTLFMPVGRGKASRSELELDSDDVYRLALMIEEKEKQVGDRLTLFKDGFYPWLLDGNSLPEPAWMRSHNIGCAAGTSSIFLTADGNVVPCPFLRHLVAGNVLRDDFIEIWRSGVFSIFRYLCQNDLKGKCSSCSHLGGECYGGCRAAALASSGDIYGEDPLCWKQ
jgi:radical SAM protein with 4Fe4S-binding SPASM domain